MSGKCTRLHVCVNDASELGQLGHVEQETDYPISLAPEEYREAQRPAGRKPENIPTEPH